MKERPILFSAPMVRALLDGSKTQTRRICKSQPYGNGIRFDGNEFLCHNDYLPPSATLMDVKRGGIEYTTSDHEGWESECPYGQPGDRLWVRESFDIIDGQTPGYVIGVDYRASHPECRPTSPTGERFEAGRDAWQWRMKDTHGMRKWKPSIHMPRTASRITLEITGVRVERLQEISEGDALAEGVKPLQDAGAVFAPAKSAYCDLWESINGIGTWFSNPWVWVLEFRRIEA